MVFFTRSARQHDGQRQRQGVWMAACTVLALLLSACGDAGTESSKDSGGKSVDAGNGPQVGVVVLQAQSQQLDTVLPGRVHAFQVAEIRPQVSGIVQKRLFSEGAWVKQGQPLYQIDAAMFRAALTSAEASLSKAQAYQQIQQATAQRNAELVKINAISQQVFQESQAAVKQAGAEVAVARANVEIARINLRYSRIEAPISGRVSLSTVTPGALVTANQVTALTEIVQTDPVYVDFTQSTAQLLALQRDVAAGRYQRADGGRHGAQVPIRLQLEDASLYPHEGRLQFSGLIANPTMGTVTLRAVVPNPDGLLLAGMYVQAKLPTGLAPEAILVPQPSVSRDLTGRASVLVVTADDMVEKRPVELNRAIGSQWLVEAGLQAGERVVVDGLQRIKPGDKVRAVQVDMQGEPSAGQPDATAQAQAAAAALRAVSGQK